MATKITQEEIDALEYKALHPDQSVICPHCGGQLQYRSVGNSYEVKCENEKCIKETVRGI